MIFNMKKTFLVTGGAGFIGLHLCKRLLKENFKIVALDNLNPYYSIKLKKARIEELYKEGGDFSFIDGDIENIEFPDHYNYKKNEIENLILQAKEKGLKLITTEKDYFRIKKTFRKDISFLKVELSVDQEKQFYKYLNERL